MLTESIFVDTSAWVALADSDDAHHDKAREIYPELLKRYKTLFTTNLVIAETYILLLKALGHGKALEFLEIINASPRIAKLYSTNDIENEAMTILRKYHDHNFSYTDAVSFAAMKRHETKKAFTFDNHFTVMKFTKIPE